jgi:RNA polymerase sigma-70 factor, ECF subfamily
MGPSQMERSPSGGRTDRSAIGQALDQTRAAEQFRQIVVPHLADGLALARWLVGNSSDAEDVVQDACMRALRAIGNYRGGSPRAWLLAIVRNTAFSWLARQRSSSLVMVGDLADIDEVSAQAPAGGADPQPTPESELIRRADQQTIATALAAMTLPMREVVVLRDVNGFSYKEIAEVLNLPIGTVMSRLSRGRQQLAALVRRAEQ